MRKLRIVIQDDDPVILQLFRDFFDGESCEVITSEEPVVCFIPDARRNACPQARLCADVFLIDYKMPGMNGLELIREQIRMGCSRDVQNKALITGMYTEELRREAEELGCVMFEKPFSFSELRAWVAECRKRVDLSEPLATLTREPRVPGGRTIAYVDGNAGRRLKAFIVNRSNSGLCLEMLSPLAKEENVLIYRDVRGSQRRAASVRWVRETGTGLYEAGFQFAG